MLTRDFPGAIRRRNSNGAVRQEDANDAHNRGTMSNHFVPAMLKFPGDNPRQDLTDLFVFASPQSPGALSFGVNPFSPFFAKAIALSVWRLSHFEHRRSAQQEGVRRAG